MSLLLLQVFTISTRTKNSGVQKAGWSKLPPKRHLLSYPRFDP